MHSLTFDSHLAILDPDTGMGVLVLPDPVDEDRYLPASGGGVLMADTAVGNWFRLDTAEYVLTMRKLSSIGWELPWDQDDVPTWSDAGCTDCCGRTMIILHSLEPLDPDPSLQKLIDATRRIQDAAAQACCGTG